LTGAPRETLRLDKWLWFARFCRTRSLATDLVVAGRVRLNGQRVVKPAHPVGAGDVLTFPQGDRIRVIRLLAVAERRGPATVARALYDDLGPREGPDVAAPRPDGD
jgi:ribosome-associated heat shock protein Hsp15